MDLTYTPAEQAFRAMLRDFLARELPADLVAKVRSGVDLAKGDYERWHAILNARGWLARGWPERFGGPGWTAVERHIFEEEVALAGAPRILPFGLTMLGPVLMKFGSAEQQAFFLPRILNGEHWWCQGYSEPGAGSDLAALSTRAERDGADYIVTGQKTWTTLAQFANWIFCLVRTSAEGKPQEGISFLLIDLQSPGVTIRPIRLIDGSVEVNEVWFDRVRVPARNLVGQENRGWDQAKYLLTLERTNLAGVGNAKAMLARLRRIGAERLAADPLFAARVAEVEIDLMAMETTNLRVVARAAAGGSPGVESSMLKIKGTIIRQELSHLMRLVVGAEALPFPVDDLGHMIAGTRPEAAQYFNNRKLSIFGGSNEIQRGLIAREILGM